MIPTTLTEQLTTVFYLWEQRGRGWQLWDRCVELEPPFEPFFFYYLPLSFPVDDGRKPTLLSSLADWFSSMFQPSRSSRVSEVSTLPYSAILEPDPFVDESPIVELKVSLPRESKSAADVAEHFLLNLSYCRSPVSFEIAGARDSIATQFACREADFPQVAQELQAYFPDATVEKRSNSLQSLRDETKETFLIDFGLADEFMRPLMAFDRFEPDPLIGLIGALENLGPGETGLVQILFQAARRPWAESIMRAVTTSDGESFFADAPEMVPLAREKTQQPLFSVVLRIAAQSPSEDRAWEIARSLAGGLTTLTRPESNGLTPLSNDDYDGDEHLDDIILRRSHRSGMLLNSGELVSLAHLPSASVKSAKLRGQERKTRAVPAIGVGNRFVLGENIHQGVVAEVSLSTEQRLRHVHIIGATGTGKSTLLLRMILQDLGLGNGCAVLDPHGDLIDAILERVPENRSEDVVLFDPADTEHPVGFNILEARTEVEKNVLASDLVAIFRRFATSWGDQMTTVLGHAVSAFLESGQAGTLIELRRFLIEKDYRQAFLPDVRDPTIAYFWDKEFPLLRGAPLSSILTRLDIFLRPRLVRNIVGQSKGIDCEEIVNGKKILLVKLAQGLIGEENAYLLGSLLISKLHQVVMGRQAKGLEQRTPFFLYLDEFQHFVTPSMATILGGARKFSLGLILAHQDLRQLWGEDLTLANSVITNPGTRICFRLGDFDAEKLKDGFAHFDASDLQNLSVGEAIGRIDRKEFDFNLRTIAPPAVTPEMAQARKEKIVSLSRGKYGHAIAGSVETEIRETKPVTPEPLPEVRKRQEMKVTVAPTAEAKRVAPPVGPAGREESPHRYLQTIVKMTAEQRGYRAVIEEPTPDGKGRVDVGLERDGKRIAVEISVTTDSEQELHNIEKCLRAGYGTVIVCSPEKKNLEPIRKLITEKLSSIDQSKILLFEPQDLILFLDDQVVQESNKEIQVKGYRVKVQYQPTSELDRQKKQEQLARVIAGSLRRIKGKT